MTQEPYATKNQFDRLALKVDIFEKELKVLKAEIQATLLTIQERILLDSYPALRDENAAAANHSNGHQARQWQVKKLGVGQVAAVPGIYTEEPAPETPVTPPFYPPIDADTDPYYDAYEYDPRSTGEVPRAYPPPLDTPREPKRSSHEQYPIVEQPWDNRPDVQRNPPAARGSNHDPQPDYRNYQAPNPPRWDARQEPPPQQYPPPGVPNHSTNGNGNGNGHRPPANGSPLGEMLDRLRASYPPNRASDAGARPNGNGHRPQPPQEEPVSRASNAALQSMFGVPAQPNDPYPETSYDAPVADIHIWLELDKWVNEKVKEVGVAGALELARLYGGQEREILLKLITIYDDRSGKPDASPMPAAQPLPSTQPEPPSLPEKAPWQTHADAEKAKYASYRPFGEHQELVLQLLADVLRSGATTPPPTNGNGTQRKR